ncbi:hypothetical protein BWQ93_03045 [Sphingopyxis sp. QXT-31]|uniref:hypothetical protein n=1 Tax=Sphingopyxis sp. QXT-31 TaxID=1357916 RepID=UPI00097944C2|nr:hypothetical protein [Sphingopyxis sp. QXT-31]APZ97574.1 hypothetical protein BWQ93_03045 [Sphingopyxis sp. QXT-31]
MKQSLSFNIGLRAGGIAVLAIGWWFAARLHQLALAAPPRDHSPTMMLLAAIIFLCGSAGSALLFVGPGLWETVEVSERWRRLPDTIADAPNYRDHGW